MSSIQDLTDNQLRDAARQLADQTRREVIELAEHLIEIEARRLHLAWGYNSLWDFCERDLKLTDGVAQLRIDIARLLRTKPELKELILTKKLGLCAAGLLWRHVDDTDFEVLLAQAMRLSKRKLKELLDLRRGGPVPTKDIIRRIAPAEPTGVQAPAPLATAFAPSSPPRPAPPPPAPATASRSSSDPTSGAVSTQTPAVPAPATLAFAAPALGAPALAAPAADSLATAAPKTSLKTHRISYLATEEDVESLKRLMDLMGTDDIGAVMRAGLGRLMDEKCPRRRIAKRMKRQEARERKKAKAMRKTEQQPPAEARLAAETELTADAKSDSRPDLLSGAKPKAATVARNPNPRRPPRALADEVLASGDERCEYVAPDGTRCNASRHIQIDHFPAYAKGGQSQNRLHLRKMCSVHNTFLAREEFGDRVPAKIPVRPNKLGPDSTSTGCGSHGSETRTHLGDQAGVN